MLHPQYISGFRFEDYRKPPVRIGGLSGEIVAEKLPNTSTEYYRHIRLLGENFILKTSKEEMAWESCENNATISE